MELGWRPLAEKCAIVKAAKSVTGIGAMKFLTEKQVAQAVRELVRDAVDVRIAVAFWGKGGSTLLGLDEIRSKPRVICNLDSGACNPEELLALKKFATLRTHAQLHAKIFWTPKGVIIGSSNASTNGLWGEGKDARGWREANILVRDEAILTEVGDWFQTQWSEGRSVTAPIIEASRTLWDAGRQRAPRGRPIQQTLTDAFACDPENTEWGRVKVAFYSEGLSDEARDQVAAEQAVEPVLADAGTYEDWTGFFKPQDIIIDVDGTQKRPNVSVWAVGDKLFESGVLTYVWEKPTVEIPSLGAFRLTRQERNRFAALLPMLSTTPEFVNDGGVLLTLEDALRQSAQAVAHGR